MDEKARQAIDFMYNSQGYVDIKFVSQMSGIPELVVENILDQEGYKESGIKGQYIKSPKTIEEDVFNY